MNASQLQAGARAMPSQYPIANIAAIAQEPVTMTSLELLTLINQSRAAFGESEVRRNDFHARVRDELDGEDYEIFVVSNPNGTATEAYRLTIPQCMYVAMREAKGVRRQVQKKLEVGQAPRLPQTMAQALRLAADQAEQLEQQKEQLALAAPKVEFVNRYVQADTGSMGLRQVCKLLGAKQTDFTAFLLSRGLMYRTTPQSPLTPRAEHIHNGRFETKTGTADHGDNLHAYVQYKFTAKGVEWIAGLWGQHQAKKQAVEEV